VWTFEHTETTAASVRQLWGRWSTPLAWGEWDHGLREVTSIGPFDVGTRGTVRRVTGPRTTFVLTRVDELEGFTLMSPLPLGTLTLDHQVTPGTEPLRFTHRVIITGALASLFGRILGNRLARELPESMRRLAALAESA
jgi:hypothetical protein